MIFSSVEFFVFLAVVLVLLRVLPGEGARRWMLLAASYGFYAWWDWRFCALLAFSTLVDFHAAERLARAKDPRRRKAWLLVSLTANLGLLGFFKYAGFLADTLRPLAETLGGGMPTADIILPVGISFFTFQTLSYTIDVYRGSLAPARDLRDYALFVSFFPQLVAGPIVRGSEFLPQLDREHRLRGDDLRLGLAVFLRGFVKKVLFADTLAVFVDPVFARPEAYAPVTCRLAVLAYAGQIYYDFAGYSEMAIGVGRMLGYRLPRNFRHPYLATDITDFWRRWHITLSRWLRDYLYIPLGGNRKGRVRTEVNLLVTMLLGGLWHGAAWTFVAWGGLHGAALAAHKALGRGSPGGPLARVGSWALTFTFVTFAWIPFRSEGFSAAATMTGRVLGQGDGMTWAYVPALVVLVLGAGLHLNVLARHGRELHLDLRRPEGWVLAAVLAGAVLLFAPLGTTPFVYFQF